MITKKIKSVSKCIYYSGQNNNYRIYFYKYKSKIKEYFMVKKNVKNFNFFKVFKGTML